MKIRLNRNRLKLEHGISWRDTEVRSVCHRFRSETEESGCAKCEVGFKEPEKVLVAKVKR